MALFRGISDDVLRPLLRDGAEAWRDFLASRGKLFHGFIPADAQGALEALMPLRDECQSFLELGSGIGLITILADLLGFEAYGIEIVPELWDTSVRLAEDHGSNATFVEGSFVPTDFRGEIDLLDADFHTVTEGADGYEELGMELCDFDLVYGYPWPGEEDWMTELVRSGAGPHTRMLRYSVSDGYEVVSLSD